MGKYYCSTQGVENQGTPYGTHIHDKKSPLQACNELIELWKQEYGLRGNILVHVHNTKTYKSWKYARTVE